MILRRSQSGQSRSRARAHDKFDDVLADLSLWRFFVTGDDLSPDQKAAPETLLCRRVTAGEAVSVRTFEPATVSHQRKLEIVNELRKYFAEGDAARKPVSEAEAEDIITEAMRSVRPGYRPQP